MNDILQKLDNSFDRLQNLQIKPTQQNMEILLQTLYDLRDIYNELKQKGEDDGRQAVDPEQ